MLRRLFVTTHPMSVETLSIHFFISHFSNSLTFFQHTLRHTNSGQPTTSFDVSIPTYHNLSKRFCYTAHTPYPPYNKKIQNKY